MGWGRKGGNVLFNDALNTFYLRLNGVRHMVKDHSDRTHRTMSERSYHRATSRSCGGGGRDCVSYTSAQRLVNETADTAICPTT